MALRVPSNTGRYRHIMPIILNELILKNELFINVYLYIYLYF